MSSSPRRTTLDASYGEDSNNGIDDSNGDDPGSMQDIAISGEIATNDGGAGGTNVEPQPVQLTGTTMDKSALRRYNAWISLLMASVISYAALAVEKPTDRALGERKWSFAALGTSLVVSMLVTLCFVCPDCNPCTKAFVSSTSTTGRFVELFLSILMLILWCIGLPMIMNPANGIAVGYTQIVNANLYLASWVGFGCVVFIVGDLVGDLVGPSYTVGDNGFDVFSTVSYKRLWETRRGKWIALTALTVIALSSSVRVFQAYDCGLQTMNPNATCIDSKVAISMMVLATILSLVMSCVSGSGSAMSEYIENIGAIATMVVVTIGLGFITFGEGPGHSLGNLFFATWGAFVVSVLITADCFRDVIMQRAQSALASVMPAANNPDVIDEQIEMQGGADIVDI